MALKKSDLYSALWASCDQLDGDSDEFKPAVTIPPGASFKDMVALKGSPTSAARSTR